MSVIKVEEMGKGNAIYSMNDCNHMAKLYNFRRTFIKFTFYMHFYWGVIKIFHLQLEESTLYKMLNLHLNFTADVPDEHKLFKIRSQR